MDNKIRDKVNERDLLCVLCNSRGVDLHHIVPRGAGGNDILDNLVLLCRECHSSKVHGIGAKEYKRLLIEYILSHKNK